MLVALIHEVCVNAVPKYYPFVPGRYATDDEYYSLMGYVKNDEGTAFETTDSYVDRMTGIMLFYAAFLQVDAPNHPHGVDAAWRWLARLLNRCPPNRHTAVALDSFLKIAGFRMYAAYRGQFVKVLELIHREFLPKLDAKNDPDIRVVAHRDVPTGESVHEISRRPRHAQHRHQLAHVLSARDVRIICL